MAITGCGLIAVTICPVQVALGEIGSGSYLVSTTCRAGSSLSQILVGILEVVDNLFLQAHNDCWIFCDEAAAKKLKLKKYYAWRSATKLGL